MRIRICTFIGCVGVTLSFASLAAAQELQLVSPTQVVIPAHNSPSGLCDTKLRVEPGTTYTRVFTIKNSDAGNLLTIGQPYIQPTGSGSDALVPFFAVSAPGSASVANGGSTQFTVEYYLPNDAVVNHLFNTLVEVMVPTNDPAYAGVGNDYGFKLGMEGFESVPAIGDIHVQLTEAPLLKVNKKGQVSLAFSATVTNPGAQDAAPAYYSAFVSTGSDLVIPAEPVRSKLLKKPFVAGASKLMKFKLKNLPSSGYIYFAGVPSSDQDFSDNWFVLPFAAP